MKAYPFDEIEKKWQKYWEENEIFKATEDPKKKKFYVLDMFPYPSGAGLHIGHPEGYAATDIVARYKRAKGYNVLHPMGFDAFGLPTERYSMQTGIHPAEATKKNVENFKRQLKMLGFSYDWSREINTTDPSYYKWTQWMFLLIYNSWYDEKEERARPIEELPIPEDITDPLEIERYKDERRLAYIDMAPVNWCEELGTVLANEEVEEWREKGYEVERKPMRQWMIRITKYARRLLDDLELLDWPRSTIEMQKNWIGKSEGAEIEFPVKNSDKTIRVFTTRPDTIFGATYMVLAPEHPLVEVLTAEDKRREVAEYVKRASFMTDIERMEGSKEKTGVFIGAFAINPANGEEIPIWIADYVLARYGFGAIMAVPGHDERDYEFAKKFGLPIVQVVDSKGGGVDLESGAFVEEGIAVNSSSEEIDINGAPSEKAKELVCEWLERKGIGKRKTQYKLRDWLFSRQRYWGEPIPIIFFEDGTKRALEPDELPLTLPDVSDFKPAGTGESPLAKVKEWIEYKDPKTGKIGKLETNTMPQWAGSCWYYLRYIDPKNDEAFCDKEKERYWMRPNGVDLYLGGAEHAVLHLLYARFWHKVLYDYGYVSTPEPFYKLFHQGLIMGEDGRKMSKSLGNVINPDEIAKEYGADSIRVFLMFLGPLQDSKPWSTEGIAGVNRFLAKIWRMVADKDGKLSPSIKENVSLTPELEYVLNYTIKKVGEDIENLRFNTAVAQMMIFVNEFSKLREKPKDAIEKFVVCLAPFAPHLAEELWRILGNDESVANAPFPEYDESKIVKREIEFVAQVNGKIRAKIPTKPDLGKDAYLEMAKEHPNVKKYLEGKTIRKIIYVENKLINIIAN